MRRIAAALVGVGLLWQPGTAAAGGSETRYVDGDGSAGGGRGCDGAGRAFTHIQRAIDASGPGDIVLVCPGSYLEALSVSGTRKSGIVIRATQRRRAIVRAYGDRTWSVVVDQAAGVRVEGLTLVQCGTEGGGVRVTGTSPGVVIRDNAIRPEGGCPHHAGIVVNGAARARIAQNTIHNFYHDGISVQGAWATVISNTVRFHRMTDGYGSGEGCHRQAARGGTIPAGLPNTHGIFVGGVGAVIRQNTIVGQDPDERWSQVLCVGILAGGDGLVVAGNHIVDTGDGIRIGGSDIVVSHNRVTGRTYGWVSYSSLGIAIWSADGGIVRGNEVHASAGGLHIDIEPPFRQAFGQRGGDTSHDLAIQDNDLRGNAGSDCRDGTDGTGTSGTANRWVRNLGDESSPAGICSPS